MHDPTKLVDFLRDNPISFLWVAGSLSAAGAMSCIFAYLSVFDKNLIWLVELNDILKVSVIFAGAVIFFIYSINIYYYIRHSHYRLNWFDVAMAIIITISFLITIIYKLLVESNDKAGVVGFYISLAFMVYLLYACAKLFEAARAQLDDIGFFSTDDILTLVSIILITGITSSVCYGNYVKYVMDHKLIIEFDMKNGDISKLENAAIVMMLSHHCIITANGKTYMLRTPDITQVYTH